MSRHPLLGVGLADHAFATSIEFRVNQLWERSRWHKGSEGIRGVHLSGEGADLHLWLALRDSGYTKCVFTKFVLTVTTVTTVQYVLIGFLFSKT